MEWHAEDGRQVGIQEPIAQVQLSDLPVCRIQPGECRAYQSTKF